MPKFRLAAVLRARQAQESAAKAAAARARHAAAAATEDVHRQAATLDAAANVDPVIASALALAMTGRQAMAAALAAAIKIGELANGHVAERQADLAVAAAQRRAMDKLAERHAQIQVRAADAAERRELDDLAGSRHRRQLLAGGEIA